MMVKFGFSIDASGEMKQLCREGGELEAHGLGIILLIWCCKLSWKLSDGFKISEEGVEDLLYEGASYCFGGFRPKAEAWWNSFLDDLTNLSN